MRIKRKEDTAEDGTYNCSSFIVFVNCFVDHLLALFFSNEVLRFDLIHPVRHLVNYSSGPVARLL